MERANLIHFLADSADRLVRERPGDAESLLEAAELLSLGSNLMAREDEQVNAIFDAKEAA